MSRWFRCPDRIDVILPPRQWQVRRYGWRFLIIATGQFQPNGTVVLDAFRLGPLKPRTDDVMTAAFELPMAAAMRGITLDITITGARRARARTWLGGRMLIAAAWVMGCDIEVSAEPTDADVITYQPVGGGPQQFVIGRRVRHQG